MFGTTSHQSTAANSRCLVPARRATTPATRLIKRASQRPPPMPRPLRTPGQSTRRPKSLRQVAATALSPKKEAEGQLNGNEVNNGAEPRYIVAVAMRESVDEEADVERLNNLLMVLRSHPGHDSVRLMIHEQDEVTSMELPIETQYGPDLRAEISAILGEDAVSAQPILI